MRMNFKDMTAQYDVHLFIQFTNSIRQALLETRKSTIKREDTLSTLQAVCLLEVRKGQWRSWAQWTGFPGSPLGFRESWEPRCVGSILPPCDGVTSSPLICANYSSACSPESLCGSSKSLLAHQEQNNIPNTAPFPTVPSPHKPKLSYFHSVGILLRTGYYDILFLLQVMRQGDVAGRTGDCGPQISDPVPALLPPGRVTVSESLLPSEPQFPHLKIDKVEMMILYLPSSFHSFLLLPLSILFPSMMKISVVVLSNQEPHSGN